MMDFLANLCEAFLAVSAVVAILELGRWLRRNLNTDDYEDTE